MIAAVYQALEVHSAGDAFAVARRVDVAPKSSLERRRHADDCKPARRNRPAAAYPFKAMTYHTI